MYLLCNHYNILHVDVNTQSTSVPLTPGTVVDLFIDTKKVGRGTTLEPGGTLHTLPVPATYQRVAITEMDSDACIQPFIRSTFDDPDQCLGIGQITAWPLINLRKVS